MQCSTVICTIKPSNEVQTVSITGDSMRSCAHYPAIQHASSQHYHGLQGSRVQATAIIMGIDKNDVRQSFSNVASLHGARLRSMSYSNRGSGSYRSMAYRSKGDKREKSVQRSLDIVS